MCPVSVGKIHTEDSPMTSPPVLSSQAVRNQPLLTEAHHINLDILCSGVLCLPGTVHMLHMHLTQHEQCCSIQSHLSIH